MPLSSMNVQMVMSTPLNDRLSGTGGSNSRLQIYVKDTGSDRAAGSAARPEQRPSFFSNGNCYHTVTGARLTS